MHVTNASLKPRVTFAHAAAMVVMFLLAYPLLAAAGVSYWSYWMVAPVIPIALTSPILLVYNWRLAQYLRGVFPHVASEPSRWRAAFSGPPRPLARITFVHALELLGWSVTTALLYLDQRRFLSSSAVVERFAWGFIIGDLAMMVGVYILYPPTIFGMLTIQELLRAILRNARLQARIATLLATYAAVDVLFAAIYQRLALYAAATFRPQLTGFVDALYFSTMTVATVGYGDFVPATSAAKLTVVAEVLVGIVLLVVLLSAAMSRPEQQ